MIYSNACAYAIRAVARLAMIKPDGYVRLDELCEGTDLPRHFVAKIFQDLVRRGLLTSAKGRRGGFALARKPQKITLYDIVDAVDGVEGLNSCIVGLANCDDKQPCPQHEQWKAIRSQIRSFISETTVDRLSNTLKNKLELLGQPLPCIKNEGKPIQKDKRG